MGRPAYRNQFQRRHFAWPSQLLRRIRSSYLPNPRSSVSLFYNHIYSVVVVLVLVDVDVEVVVLVLVLVVVVLVLVVVVLVLVLVVVVTLA